MAQQQTADEVATGATTLAQRLEELSARIPGVEGYRRREACRETDKQVRLRLAAGLEDLGKVIEREQRRRTESHQFTHLAALGRLTSKLGKLANLVRFASRGYRGMFDAHKLDEQTLRRLYDFDLDLLDQVESLGEITAALCDERNEERLAEGVQRLDQQLDEFESVFSRRADIVRSE